jgi:hypothetical protein
METKDSPYYLGNRDCVPTLLSIKTADTQVNIELPWDVSIEDLINAFYSACIGITYQPKTVLQNMKDFADEHLDCLEIIQPI